MIGGREKGRIPARADALPMKGMGRPIVEAAIFRSGQLRRGDAHSGWDPPKERMGRDGNPATRISTVESGSVLDSGLAGIIGGGKRE
jgi:hypothetical protein